MSSSSWGKDGASKVMMDLCVVPITGSVSVRKEVAAVEAMLRDPKWKNADGSPLELALHAYGTNISGKGNNKLSEIHSQSIMIPSFLLGPLSLPLISGDWDVVMAAFKECHAMLHASGVPRVTSSLRVGSRVVSVLMLLTTRILFITKT
jgi:uncharacterized protein YqgV (UPF0045/DUF77 family)